MFSYKFCFLILTLYNWQINSLASQTTNTLLERMINSSIKSSNLPCEDFYSFACGNYPEQHDSNLYNDIISYVDHQYNTALLNLFETSNQHKLQAPNHSRRFVDNARVYFEACSQQKKRNLTKYFEEVRPAPQTNWPILQELENGGNQTFQWPSGTDGFDVWSLLGKLQSFGLNDVLIYQQILIGRQGEVSIMMAPFLINEQNALPDVKVLHVLLLQMGVKNPAKIIKELKKTHKTLLNISSNLVNNKEKSLEMTFGDLERFYPNLSLSSFLNELMDKQLPADTFIVLRNPSYFKYLNDNLWVVFEKQHLANYIMAKFVYFLAFDGSAEFKQVACIKDLRKKFDLAVNFLYHHHIFAKQATAVKQDIEEIFKTETDMLAIYFKSNYLQLPQLQIESLLDKLANVRLNVGNLPNEVNFEKIEDYYNKLAPLEENNYYRNHLVMLKHRFAKSMFNAQTQSHYIVTDNKLGSTSGAFYVPGQNMIVLPFASLMQPLYDITYNNLSKFSLLGFILAHELAHAFDTNGLNFDRSGQFSTSTSLSNVLLNAEFQKSLKCLQNQLAAESLDELIADSVAIQVVKKILTLKFKSSQPNELLPVWKKDLFLQLAQIFCNKNNIKHVDHDSDGDRLNQMVKNLEGFSQTFKCSPASKMNAQNKCRVY